MRGTETYINACIPLIKLAITNMHTTTHGDVLIFNQVDRLVVDFVIILFKA